MQKTDVELTTEAAVIRDETIALANTKLRVYNILKNIVDSKINNADAPVSPVTSVNGETGVVVLDAVDVGADPAGTAAGLIATEVTNRNLAIAALVDSSPATLDTLNELAAALADDPNFAATIATALGLKADTTFVQTELALKQSLINAAVVITDASTMDITAIKNTLTTSSATRTFTISYTGDDIALEVTLNATSSVFTFPASALCVSEGVSSGDNTCTLAGVSGDKHIFAIKKIGSAYYVAAKNFTQ